ncbi:MAG TPA: hypothetical protein VFU47_04945, partial [Armatimonadota bacterium]|nr:hypothetical protein [Armatimonadota bacterium]
MPRWAKGCLIGCAGAIVAVAALAIVAVGWFRAQLAAPKPPDPRIGRYVALRPYFLLSSGKT